MTQTQKELYNSPAFWVRRYWDQWQYIKSIKVKTFHWDGRKEQLLTSAFEVLELIKKRVAKAND